MSPENLERERYEFEQAYPGAKGLWASKSGTYVDSFYDDRWCGWVRRAEIGYRKTVRVLDQLRTDGPRPSNEQSPYMDGYKRCFNDWHWYINHTIARIVKESK